MNVLCNSVGKHLECENCGASKFHDKTSCEPCPFVEHAKCEDFNNKHSYFMTHKPTGETWVVLGVSFKRDEICVSGWPHTIAKLSDCIMIQKHKELNNDEIAYREKEFGTSWD
jgi:ribosomal protein L37E